MSMFRNLLRVLAQSVEAGLITPSEPGATPVIFVNTKPFRVNGPASFAPGGRD